MTAYNEALVAQLEARQVWTFAEAVAFAEANGLKPRSVIAKIKSMGLQYVAKPARVRKTGEPVVLKAELVKAVEASVGISLPSLAKMTREDLIALGIALGLKESQAA